MIQLPNWIESNYLFDDDIKLSEVDQFKQQIDLLDVVKTSIDQLLSKQWVWSN